MCFHLETYPRIFREIAIEICFILKQCWQLWQNKNQSLCKKLLILALNLKNRTFQCKIDKAKLFGNGKLYTGNEQFLNTMIHSAEI